MGVIDIGDGRFILRGKVVVRGREHLYREVFDGTKEDALIEDERLFQDLLFAYSEHITLTEFFDEWIEEVSNVLAVNTTLYYHYGIKTMSAIPEVTTSLNNVTAGTMRSLISKSPEGSVRIRTKKTLQAAMRYATEHELIRANPMVGLNMQIPKPTPYRDSYTLDEAIDTLDAIRDTKCEIAVLLAIFCGLRREEIAGLNWEDINLETGVISIHHAVVAVGTAVAKKTKTASSNRIVVLSGYALERIRELKQDQTGVLFKGNSVEGRVNPATISKWWKQTREAANLRYLRFENLRHTFATLAQEALVPMRDISKALGHTSTSTTAIYIPTTTQANSIATQSVSNLIEQRLRHRKDG